MRTDQSWVVAQYDSIFIILFVRDRVANVPVVIIQTRIFEYRYRLRGDVDVTVTIYVYMRCSGGARHFCRILCAVATTTSFFSLSLALKVSKIQEIR